MTNQDGRTLNVRYLAGFAVVFSSESGRLLLLRSRSNHDLWKLPGGIIEPGEDPVTGVRREVKEEVNCALQVGATLITRFEHVSPSSKLTAVLYVPTLTADEIAPQLSVEHDLHQWVRLNELDRYEIDTYLDQMAARNFLSAIERFCSTEFASTLSCLT